ncbi:MAG: hypothetical protein IJ046_02180 [Clostridia bacterium]|nr:hypothetical protein [Clostridia bacterium]
MDSNLLKKIIIGLISATDAKLSIADLNGDGTVNSKDSNCLAYLVAGKE